MEFFKIRKDIPFMKNAVAFNAVSFITFVAAVFFLLAVVCTCRSSSRAAR